MTDSTLKSPQFLISWETSPITVTASAGVLGADHDAAAAFCLQSQYDFSMTKDFKCNARVPIYPCHLAERLAALPSI